MKSISMLRDAVHRALLCHQQICINIWRLRFPINVLVTQNGIEFKIKCYVFFSKCPISVTLTALSMFVCVCVCVSMCVRACVCLCVRVSFSVHLSVCVYLKLQGQINKTHLSFYSVKSSVPSPKNSSGLHLEETG